MNLGFEASLMYIIDIGHVIRISRYPHTSPEAQMRKLADYAFMLRDYQFARSVYDSVKRDFSADKAWKYYAGAQVKYLSMCMILLW